MASKYCDRVKYCRHNWWCADDYNPERGNHECFIQLTNADRIRAMSDEELADKFRWLVCPFYWVSLPDETDRPADWSCKQNCHKCWLDWLKSPVEVDGGGAD